MGCLGESRRGERWEGKGGESKGRRVGKGREEGYGRESRVGEGRGE